MDDILLFQHHKSQPGSIQHVLFSRPGERWSRGDVSCLSSLLLFSVKVFAALKHLDGCRLKVYSISSSIWETFSSFDERTHLNSSSDVWLSRTPSCSLSLLTETKTRNRGSFGIFLFLWGSMNFTCGYVKVVSTMCSHRNKDLGAPKCFFNRVLRRSWSTCFIWRQP